MTATGIAYQAPPVQWALARVPASWRICRLKDVAIANRESLPENTDPDFTFSYIDISSVDSNGDLGDGEVLSFGASPSRARRCVRPGDSIVSTVRTYLKAIGYIDARGPGLVVSTGFATLSPRPSIHPRYLYWWLRSGPFVEDVVARSVGVSYPAVNATDVGDVAIPLPSTEEQESIAAFLDAETARIDEFIAEQERTASLVAERRWLFVSHAFSELAPVASLRRGLIRLTDGPFGSAFTSSDYSNEGAAVVRLGNIGFGEWRGDDIARIPLSLFETFRRYEVRAGDLLIASLGDERNHAGRACVAPLGLGPAMVKGKSLCARVDQRWLDAEFAALYLSSPLGAQALSVEARGATRQMINLEIVKSVQIPMPDLASQRSLVDATRREWRVADRLIADVAAQVRLLREHRQALITAAVTGGLDALRKVA